MSIQQNFPAITPSLSLNFARSKTLDPRITFSRTSTATRVNEVGLIEVVSADDPRFDHEYDSSTGAVKSLGLLVEESRSNLLTYSEDFSQWTTTNTTISATKIISPDGNVTANKVIGDSGQSTMDVRKNFSAVSGKIYTFSVFVKSSEYNLVDLQFNSLLWEDPIINLRPRLEVDLSAEDPLISQSHNSGYDIIKYPNEYFRLVLTAECVTSGTSALEIQLSPNGTGDGTSGLYVWGAQLEEGAFPTSYIPTSGSTITRNPDNVSMTGTNFSDWYNQDAGTVYVSQKLRAVQDTSRNNLVYLINANGNGNDYFYNPSRGNTNIFVFGDGGTNYSRFQDGTNSIDTKTAFAYDVSGDDFKPYYNGIESTTETTTNTPSATSHTQLELGATTADKYCGHIQQFTYYPRRLTNTQLQNLTK